MIEEADIVIVGAGASGAASAYKLSNLGLKIICLEQGDFIKPEDYPSWQYPWEIKKFKSFNPNPNIRKNRSDYPINNSNSEISIANFNAVGGSTILFSGHFPRFNTDDFRVKTLDKVASDWPINYDILSKYYNENETYLGVSGLIGDPAYPESFNRLLEPLPLGKSGELIAKGFNKLKWHWWPSYSAIISRNFNGRDKCINIGSCNLGCPQGSKSSSDITYIRDAIKNGVKVIVNSRVFNVDTSNNEVSGVQYVNTVTQQKYYIKTKIVILAANGIGTPRILLLSNNKKGIANSSGMVGKNLMLHPLGFVDGVFEESIDSTIGPQGCILSSQEFVKTDKSKAYLRGYSLQLLRGAGPIETAINGLNTRKIKFGENFEKFHQKYFNKTIGFGIIIEDLPDENNKVELDDKLEDGTGITSVKVTYKLSENSRLALKDGIKNASKVLKESGAVKVNGFGPVKNTGWHLMGTTKMGTDKKTSVVNEFGETHDIKNLYVFDSSVFPTSSCVNPANTIQALALYFSEKLSERIKGKTLKNSSSNDRF